MLWNDTKFHTFQKNKYFVLIEILCRNVFSFKSATIKNKLKKKNQKLNSYDGNVMMLRIVHHLP